MDQKAKKDRSIIKVVIGYWLLVTGYWLLVYGLWFLVSIPCALHVVSMCIACASSPLFHLAFEASKKHLRLDEAQYITP